MRSALMRTCLRVACQRNGPITRIGTATRALSKINLIDLTNSKELKKKLRSEHKDWFEDDTKIDLSNLISGNKLTNAFEMFGLEQRFDIKPSKLRSEMHNLQRLLHPDKFVNQDRETRDKSDEISAKVNEYYNILRHPYERGKYLLSLKTGQKMEDIEKKMDSLKLDAKFLGDMMDLGEKIHDESVDRIELQKLSCVLEDQMNSLTSKIKRNFELNQFEEIYENLGKLKFVANNHFALNDLLD